MASIRRASTTPTATTPPMASTPNVNRIDAPSGALGLPVRGPPGGRRRLLGGPLGDLLGVVGNVDLHCPRCVHGLEGALPGPFRRLLGRLAGRLLGPLCCRSGRHGRLVHVDAHGGRRSPWGGARNCGRARRVAGAGAGVSPRGHGDCRHGEGRVLGVGVQGLARHRLPDRAPAARLVRLLRIQFDTVEINNTFYRLPTPEAVEKWAAQAPPGFVYAVKLGAVRLAPHEAARRRSVGCRTTSIGSDASDHRSGRTSCSCRRAGSATWRGSTSS